MALSAEIRRAKLRTLVETEGYPNVEALLQTTITDSTCPAICIAEGCAYTCKMEPDQDRGWCEACGKNTMQSALVLAGMI
ncbi:MAG: hypothetical protein WB524_00360 [Acidobacteriaceae bacterium]